MTTLPVLGSIGLKVSDVCLVLLRSDLFPILRRVGAVAGVHRVPVLGDVLALPGIEEFTIQFPSLAVGGAVLHQVFGVSHWVALQSCLPPPRRRTGRNPLLVGPVGTNVWITLTGIEPLLL